VVSAQWLSERLGEVVVVDCRWSLTDPDAGRREYGAEHIAGAAHLDVTRDLSGPARVGEGRHPLPSPEAFAATAARAGIGAETPVVAYDEGNGGAARLWWLLRHFGHPAPHVLEGGFAAWSGPVASGVEAPAAPEPPFVPRPRADDVIGAEEILASGGTLDLVDARAPERFRGEREPIDPVAGHIPGARNVPFAQPLEALREQLAAGDGELAVYCGSGVTAATLALAAESAGRPARLYPGSWSAWSSRGLPAERGGPS
jgi:thiosulfate/3-mercaptopyruvate sulfurtransferase